MPRKPPMARSEAGGGPEPEAAPAGARESKRAGLFPFYPLCALVTITLGYLIVFYAGEERRQAGITLLFAPDLLFVMWCGGKLDYFSLLDRWPIVLLVTTIFGGAWLAGRLALALLGVRADLNRLERIVFAIGVGLNLLSLYALALGLAGGLQQRWAFIAPLILLAIINAALWLRNTVVNRSPGDTSEPPALRRRPTPEPNKAAGLRDKPGRSPGTDDDRRWLWWLLAVVPYALVIVLGGMLPPIAYDVREYHLQTPKEWFQNGRIDFLPHNIYANMPLGSELLSVWAMALAGGNDGWWWGAIAGKTVMACYSLVTAAGLVGLGRRVHSLAAGVIAAVIFLSTPWIVELAKAGYNENSVALDALLAIHALYLAAKGENTVRVPWLIALAGFCVGSAVACKYPPALFLVIPLTAWVGGLGWLLQSLWPESLSECLGSSAASPQPTDVEWHSTPATRSFPWRQTLRSATLFLAAAACAGGLWFGKNAVLTGNPTYPLLYNLFDGRTRTPEKDRQWTRVHSPQPDENGNRFSPSQLANGIAWIAWRTRWASVTILPLALVAWLARPQRRFIAAVAFWMLYVFLAWWLFTHRLDRFLILLLPLASLLAAIGVLALAHPAWRTATLGLVVWGLVTQLPLVTLPSDSADYRFLAPLAALKRDDFNLRDGGVRLHPAHRWLNEHAQPGERVLLVGDAEPFELQIPAIYNTCFDDCQFTRLFQGRTRAERLAALKHENIAYIFFHWPHLARFRSKGNYGYTSDYPTPGLVHEELVGQQHLLTKIDLGLPPEQGELYARADE